MYIKLAISITLISLILLVSCNDQGARNRGGGTPSIQKAAKPIADSEIAVPGFGSLYDGIDPLTGKIANTLMELTGAGECMQWCASFVAGLQRANIGWLPTGLFAAVLCDLGFNPKTGAGLYQLCSAPGLLAHGMELVGKPITAVPFPADDHYHIETENAE